MDENSTSNEPGGLLSSPLPDRVKLRLVTFNIYNLYPNVYLDVRRMLPGAHPSVYDRMVEDMCTHAVLYAATGEPWHAIFHSSTLEGRTLTDDDKQQLVRTMEYIAHSIKTIVTNLYGEPPDFMFLYEQYGCLFTIQIT